MPNMETTATTAAAPTPTLKEADGRTQSCGVVLELSPDWLILRASENTHGFLGEYPARLVGEPLSKFTLAQPLHDLRNSLSRQRSSNGVARAYRIRLTHEPRHFDMAFQQLESRMLLECLPCSHEGFGDELGAVSRLLDGLAGDTVESLCENATRRMRALTGFDRVTLILSGGNRTHRCDSSRSKFAASAKGLPLPGIVGDVSAKSVSIFPVEKGDTAIGQALMRALTPDEREELELNEVRSALCVPLARQGRQMGFFRFESRTPRAPSLELHAAAELFAQMVGIELERLGA